jgi:SAM-dependent methyltransferase
VSERLAFTGERLDDDDPLFGVDLAQHRAAYAEAARHGRGARVLDLGSGRGYGAAELAEGAAFVLGIDRVPPAARLRGGAARFALADLRALPVAAGSFDLVVSFQVLEHLEDPTLYLEAMRRALRPPGVALLTTPNVQMSFGVNPFHVHEYEAAELRALLVRHFARVDVHGVNASERVLAHWEARRLRVQRILRLDPLGLRHRLPRPLVERGFGQLARLVRQLARRSEGLPEADLGDFSIGAPTARSLDLLAVCSAG